MVAKVCRTNGEQSLNQWPLDPLATNTPAPQCNFDYLTVTWTPGKPAFLLAIVLGLLTAATAPDTHALPAGPVTADVTSKTEFKCIIAQFMRY